MWLNLECKNTLSSTWAYSNGYYHEEQQVKKRKRRWGRIHHKAMKWLFEGDEESPYLFWEQNVDSHLELHQNNRVWQALPFI